MTACSAARKRSVNLERCVVNVLEYLMVASSMASMRAADPLSSIGNPYQELSLLKHRTIGAAIWHLQAGDYPMISQAMAVEWVLGSSSMPSIVCHEAIDINHPTLPMPATVRDVLVVEDRTLPLQEGEVVLLLAQATPNENGAYVYIGEGLPLMR